MYFFLVPARTFYKLSELPVIPAKSPVAEDYLCAAGFLSGSIRSQRFPYKSSKTAILKKPCRRTDFLWQFSARYVPDTVSLFKFISFNGLFLFRANGFSSFPMGRKIFLICLAAACFITRGYGQEKDSIILYNGQVLIGDVQNASLGSLAIDDTDLKMLNIKLFRIRRLIIREQFKIELVDKKIYYGTMRTTDKDGWVEILTRDSLRVQAHILRIYQLTSIEGGFFMRLNGNVSAGFSYTKSSGIGQFNISSNIQYATKNINYSLVASSITSLDSGKVSRDNENLQLFAAYDLTPTWFLAASAQYQRNLELSISRRWLGLVGPGNNLVIKKNWRLMVVTGMTFSQEKSVEGVASGLLFQLPVMFQFNFYQFRNPDIQISSNQAVYFGISEQGRVRYDGNTSFSWQLIRYFYLNINPYMNFDSKPPAGSSSTFDYGIVVGLSYKF
jgi:hypothetical protein